MIYFIVTYKNRHAINKYLGLIEQGLFWGIKPIYYHQVERYLDQMRSGAVIFSDIELLNSSGRKAVGVVHQKLSQRPGLKILNHPERSMRRYELLNHLHAQKINQFRVYRPTDQLDDIRFPVYLRFENDHSGSQTDLIHDKDSLDKQLESFDSHEDLLITEFCDTSDDQNIFRKYSAFRVNGQILPRHVFFGQKWCLKMAGNKQKELFQEELDYVKNNPHEDRLSSIFETANIDYGRIDYSLKDGNIQVWEINTNPTVMPPGFMDKKSYRYPVHEWFRIQFKQALLDLGAASKSPGNRLAHFPLRRIFFVYYHLTIRTILLMPKFIRQFLER